MSQKLNIDHELYEAAAKGNSKRVTELLSQDYDFDSSYNHPLTKLTALAVSVKEGYCHIVSILLKHGFNSNKSVLNEGGLRVSLLHLAAVSGYPAIVKLLLHTGANPKADANNWSYFDRSVVMEEKVARLLCENASTAEEILVQMQREHKQFPSYGMKRTIKLIKRCIAAKATVNKKHNNIIMRVQSLLSEVDEINSFLQWATRRLHAEEELKNVLQITSVEQDVVLLATAKLQFQEKLLSKFGILEDDCMSLSVRREILLAEVTALYAHLQDRKETSFLQHLTTIRTTLLKVDLTTLVTAVKSGLLRTSTMEYKKTHSEDSEASAAVVAITKTGSVTNPLPSIFRPPPPPSPPPTTTAVPATFRPPPPTANPLSFIFRPPPPPLTTATNLHRPPPSALATNTFSPLPSTFRPPPPPLSVANPLLSTSQPAVNPLPGTFHTPPPLLQEICLQKQQRAQYLEKLKLQLQALMLRTQQQEQQEGGDERGYVEEQEHEVEEKYSDDCDLMRLSQQHHKQHDIVEEEESEEEYSSDDSSVYSEEQYTDASELEEVEDEGAFLVV